MRKLTDLNIHQKRLVIREDFNVPIENGRITHDARIRRALPTIRYALSQQAAVILLSHLGRPKEGQAKDSDSLRPVAHSLSGLLDHPVRFETDYLEGIDCTAGQIVLCENVRFNLGEQSNDSTLAKKLAALGDIFVMDAFATAHRAHASTTGIVAYAPLSCAGPLLIEELNALGKALNTPKKPVLAIVGGAKVSTKINLLRALIKRTERLVLGGGIANTFLAAKGYSVGASLYEPEHVPLAKSLLEYADQHHCILMLPSDAVVAEQLSAQATPRQCTINAIQSNDRILDIGPETAQAYAQAIKEASTLIWNGPVGVFEYAPFKAGTQAVATAVAQSSAYSIAGGGDTLAAIDQFGVSHHISYISTGGGAFLAWLEGTSLPAIAALEERAHEHETH